MAQAIVASPVTTRGLSAAQSTALRGLESVVMDSVKNVRDYIPMLYKKNTFQPLTITKKVYAGIPDAVAWDGIQVLTPNTMSYLYDATATQYLYGNSFSYTYESKVFDLYDFNAKGAAELGKSAAVKLQKLAFDFFNSAFSTNWYDGVTFFATNHPYAANSGLSTTQRNTATGALSLASILDACVKLRNVKDPLGRPMNLTPGRLFVDETLVPSAREYLNLGQGMKSGTANNDRNPFEDFQIEVVGVPYWTTSSRWVLQAKEFETYCSMLVPVTTSQKEDEAHGIKQDIWFSFATWGENWRHYVGYTG